MSFLLQLQQKKEKLKPTETIVTQQDGQKFLESPSGTKSLDSTSPGYIIDTEPDDIPAKVTEHLYLGSQDCCELDILKHYDIKHVLSLGVKAPLTSPEVTYKFVKMLDLEQTDLNKYLPECISFIDNGLGHNENVLVHCNAGVSRSASVVISYLVLRNDMNFESAYDTVKKARPCIRPNDGFMVQLRNMKNVLG